MPPLSYLYANVNGAWTKNLGEARKLKREGLKNGIPDMTLAYPTATHAGLYIELKVGRNKTSSFQKEWLKKLKAVDWFNI